jgi:hypothetical protein
LRKGLIPTDEEEIILNVGGEIFVTNLKSLTSSKYAGETNMLNETFSGKHEIEKDSDGQFIIDRDGKNFKIILDYIKKGSESLKNISKNILVEVYNEAIFYNIINLENEIYKST